jgi:vacuolar-type H+-ATPase subunit E/Vma4
VTVAVEPARVALLAQAEDDADLMLRAADDQAAATLAEADAQGRQLIELARSEGAAAASTEGAYEEARARRRSRTLVLAAQQELYDELRRQAREAARGLRHDPRYPELLDRLSAAAGAQLGEGAQLDVDPPGAGGVRAVSGRRHVDYTLDALADRCLERLGSGLERLWT